MLDNRQVLIAKLRNPLPHYVGKRSRGRIQTLLLEAAAALEAAPYPARAPAHVRPSEPEVSYPAGDFPALSEALLRYDAAFNLLQGLSDEFLACATSGRLQDWSAAARSIIALIEGRAPKVFENEPRKAEPREDLSAVAGS